MDAKETKAVFSAILDLGEIMLRSGAEVYRVEDTVKRLVAAYGGQSSHVFAIPSHVVVTARFDGEEYNLSRRVLNVQTNLDTLDHVNDLARRLCRETPRAEEIRAHLQAATKNRGYYGYQKIGIFAFISLSFTLFFGGNLMDGLISALLGVVVFFAMGISRRIGGNLLFTDILCAAITAFLAVISVRIGIGSDADKIIIGNIMLLIPGVELVNGIRDFIAGDIQAGMMHVAEALFLAIGIAVGAAGVLTLMGGAMV